MSIGTNEGVKMKSFNTIMRFNRVFKNISKKMLDAHDRNDSKAFTKYVNLGNKLFLYRAKKEGKKIFIRTEKEILENIEKIRASHTK